MNTEKNKENNKNKEKNGGEITGAGSENPFRRKSVIMRSPPTNLVHGGMTSISAAMGGGRAGPLPPTSIYCNTSSPSGSLGGGKTQTNRVGGDESFAQLKMEEELAFVNLGNKLNAMNAVVTDAKNIHKSIRDNLMQAVALYQQLRENREAIALINITETPQNKALVETMDRNVQTEGDVNSRDASKRAASLSPEKATSNNKKIRTTQSIEENNSKEEEKPWSLVESKKKKFKKKVSSKSLVKIKGESVTIKTGSSSYADILKEMKTVIKPEEIGVSIRKIRRTKDGNVLVEMMKGEGQAKKLESAIKESLGEDMQVHTLTEKFLVDIRDIEESTKEEEIVDSVLQASGETDAGEIKVRNMRDYYGGTKQALVEVPANIASTILKRNKIRVGLVVCRIRRKIFAKRCYRCLEHGHLARSCKGTDRSQACMKCGINGHKAKECKNEPRCVICLEAGRHNISHYIGTDVACNNRNGS